MYYSINECYRFHYYGDTVFCYCPGETSIYLNRAQILVLKYCDGSNTIDEIYSKVSNELKITDTNLIKNKNMKTESSKTSINYTGEYGLKYPKALVLELTSFCNFDCLHCFHGSNKKQKYFSLEFAKILSTKYKNKISTIDVTGGEATLHQDFEKICNLLQQSFEVNLLTNGSMLHNINVDVLKHFHDIQVSLYGYNYDTFLSFTKNSSAYNQVTEGINYLKNNKIPYTSVVCITQHNLNQLNDYVKFAIKSGSKKMKFTLSFPVGNVNKDNYYSEFQITEIVEDYEYRYGFEYNATCIVAEWLYTKNLKTNRNSIVFERTTENVEFGATVRKECDLYKEQVPAETLVLSFFNKLKLKKDIFREVYSSIMDTLVVPTDFCEDQRMLEKLLPQVIDHEKNKLVQFLSAIDTGIKDIEYDDTEKELKFTTYHLGKDGETYPLNLYCESEGTLKSIMLFIYSRMAILYNRSMFVDELNVKLHPLLLKFIIDLFYDKDSTAQLIYTTHDTTLMDKKFFRRDQIWFVQKDEDGYSELSSLSDFKVRSDASFEKDYLAGVYGGIPFLKEFDMKEGE